MLLWVFAEKSSYPIIHSSATEFDAFDPSTVVLELDQAQPDSRFTRTEKWMNESKDTDQDMHYTPGIDSASITKILLDQWIQVCQHFFLGSFSHISNHFLYIKFNL